MMGYFIAAAAVAALVVVALAIIVARQPAGFRIARSATLAAPAATLFAKVNDFRQWTEWSPWENIDPALRRSYEGAPAGVGAIYSWAGNGKVGSGRMTILESRPAELIRLRLEFLKPMKAVNTTEFTFRPDGDKTAVAWIMTGEKNFMAKAFHMLMDMDKLVGGDFEKGLANLEKAAQTAA